MMWYLNHALRGIPRRPLAIVIITLLVINILSWCAVWALAPFQADIYALSGLAWALGARHAFDIDHIAAIDNVTRKLHREGKRPVATGLFFALGHSSVVIVLSVLIALGAHGAATQFRFLSTFGGIFGTGISAAFLTLIGITNLTILWQLATLYRSRRRGTPESDQEIESLDKLLNRRGMIASSLRFLFRHIRQSWHMYPLGMLFGLGFDTATEVAILGLSATMATSSDFPIWGIIIFPFLFTAGMTLFDSTDALIMLRTYNWAVSDAMRRLTFNILITTVTVGISLIVGALEWLQLVGRRLDWNTAFDSWLNSLSFGTIGIVLVLLMVGIWVLAIVYDRLRLPPRSDLTHDYES